MSLILNAIAFISQESLAKLTRSPKQCAICGLRYGVLGLKGVALPCGHIFGECKCCAGKAGPSSTDCRKSIRPSLGSCSSAELECPYCAISAVSETCPGLKDYDAAAALHAAERILRRDTKLELQRLLKLAAMKLPNECEDIDDNEDDDWIFVPTVDQYLEMDFNEILEYGS